MMLHRLFSWLFRVVGRWYKDPRNQQRIEHCDVARRTTTVKVVGHPCCLYPVAVR
jgi:hypothetical protein